MGPRNDNHPAPTPTPPPTTRLAPSPTGALHPGNARTFLVNWALARTRGWEILLRIEDLDTPRIKPGAVDQTVDLLRWLGIDWDRGPLVQSDDTAPSAEAMRTLAAQRSVYPCELTRAQIEAAASAPNEGDHETRFSPQLRPVVLPDRFEDTGSNWRFVVEPGAAEFHDAFAGPVSIDPSQTVGDFVVWTKRGLPAYQLAVVVDDARQGVTHVVRGDDLLDSTARQLRLINALGLGAPGYTHLPLVRGPDGRRLAKRHGDSRLSTYRDRGVPAERVVGLCARWCGLTARREAMSAQEFLAGFDLGRIPAGDVVFTPEDDAWLGH